MTARERALLALLRECETALTTWIHQYAPEQCGKDAVMQSRLLVEDAGGTLAFIGKLLGKIRAHTGRKRVR